MEKDDCAQVFTNRDINSEGFLEFMVNTIEFMGLKDTDLLMIIEDEENTSYKIKQVSEIKEKYNSVKNTNNYIID